MVIYTRATSKIFPLLGLSLSERDSYNVLDWCRVNTNIGWLLDVAWVGGVNCACWLVFWKFKMISEKSRILGPLFSWRNSCLKKIAGTSTPSPLGLIMPSFYRSSRITARISFFSNSLFSLYELYILYKKMMNVFLISSQAKQLINM